MVFLNTSHMCLLSSNHLERLFIQFSVFPIRVPLCDPSCLYGDWHSPRLSLSAPVSHHYIALHFPFVLLASKTSSISSSYSFKGNRLLVHFYNSIYQNHFYGFRSPPSTSNDAYHNSTPTLRLYVVICGGVSLFCSIGIIFPLFYLVLATEIPKLTHYGMV